jgi:hypothetical protein
MKKDIEAKHSLYIDKSECGSNTHRLFSFSIIKIGCVCPQANSSVLLFLKA